MKIDQYKTTLGPLIVLALLLMACGEKENLHHRTEPAQIEHLENSELSRLILEEKAISRLGIQTALVSEATTVPEETGAKIIVPYGSLLYDVKGRIWVYKNLEPRTFVRHEVKVDFIKENKAFLLEGPPVGTPVVSVGAAELYGTEYEVGH